MENNENFSKNFVKLIKIFKSHPFMFLHFLESNNAIKQDFKNKLTKSLIKDKENFTDIDKMLKYYLTLLDTKNKPQEDSELDFNKKLFYLLSEQKYEEAAKLRDIMIKKNFKINI